MKIYIIFFVLFYLALSTESKAQKIKMIKNDNKLFLGFAFGTGFFSPQDVNDYIKNNLEINSDLTSLFMNFSGKISMFYKMKNGIEIGGSGEYVWSPKYIVTNYGDDKYYHFDRFSLGIFSNYHFNISDETKTFFLGASLSFHNMTFERYNASTVGFAGQTGLSLDQNNINIRFYLSGEYAKAIDNTNYRNFELNYSGIRIIAEINFNLL